MESSPSASLRAALTPVPQDQYGLVLAELRQAVCDEKGVVRRIADGQLSLNVRMGNLEASHLRFIDPITKRARAALIVSGAALGGLLAGFIVELALRLLATGAGQVLSNLAAAYHGG